jgi:hypothetical protein
MFLFKLLHFLKSAFQIKQILLLHKVDQISGKPENIEHVQPDLQASSASPYSLPPFAKSSAWPKLV